MNAAIALLRLGYVQEVGVLCRCADEFFEDVMFLSAPLGTEGTCSEHQKQMVEELFQEELSGSGGSIMNAPKRDRVRRNKVRAGIARIHGMPINPHDASRIQRRLGSTFSGYVHGAYPHIMEMYGGPSPNARHFHTAGMTATPRIDEFVHAVASRVYRLAISAQIVAMRCRNDIVKVKLVGTREGFEQTTGVGLDDPNTVLDHIKRR